MTNAITEAKMRRIHELTQKFFRTAPANVKNVFTAEEIELLKSEGIIHRPHGRKYSENEAAVMGAAYTKLS